MDLDPIRLKVLDLIERTGTDLKKASLACGKNAAYVHQFIYRGTPKVLPEDVREALAKHLGVNDRALRHPEVPQRKTPARLENEDGDHPEGDARKRPRRSAAGFSSITEIDVRASAGPGAFHEGLEEAKTTWLFPDDVIRHEFRARPEDLHIVTIDGDSMEPHSDPTKIVIKSLNPEYQTYERNADEVNIIGRVVWASKRF